MKPFGRPRGVRWAGLSKGRMSFAAMWIVCVAVGLFPQTWAIAGEPTTTEPGFPTTLPPEQLDPTVEGKLKRAEELLKDNQFEEAVAPALAAVRQAAGDAKDRVLLDRAVRFVLQLADRAKEAERYGVAQHCYAQVRSMYPDKLLSGEPLLGLADVARLTDRNWEAYEYYSAYLKLSNRTPDHRGELGMGLTCVALGQNASAVIYLRTAVRRSPNNAEAHMALARALQGENKNREAVESARRAIQLDEAQPPEKRRRDYRYYLAVILKSAQQTDEALAVARELADTLRSAIKMDPTTVKNIDDLERVLILRYQLLEMQTKTEEGSKNPQLYLELAQVVEEQGAIQQIRAQYRAIENVLIAQQLQPENTTILLRLAGLYRLVGNTNEAIKAYQEILKISPGQTDAKEALRSLGAPLTAPEPTSAPATAPISASGAKGR